MLSHVFTPGRIGTLPLPHRIIMGSMHLGIEDADAERDALAEFYAARVRGGAGLIITGGSAISQEAAGGRHYSFVNDPRDHERLAHVAARVHGEGGIIALQLFHAGRYARRADFGVQPVAPSAIPSRFSTEPPHALNPAEIATTIDDFAHAAQIAQQLGFDGVELMGSEGYLLNEFCSPLTNQRDDEWGGDASRRCRFPLAVVAALRAAVGPDFPVLYRMSGDDLMPGSSTPAETVALARALVATGVDALNVGIGWHESSVPTVQHLVPAGTWLPQTIRIKHAVTPCPVTTGNRINRLSQAEQILADDAADFVSMSRPFLADSALLQASRTNNAVNICIGCNQACIDRSLVDERVSCLVNPLAVRESETPPRVLGVHKYVVIGGGPAGMAAARELALHGQHVVLYESEEEFGGQFRMARRVPGKKDYGATIEYYAAASGPVAVIGGGGIAVDLAHLLVSRQTSYPTITVMRRSGKIGAGLGRTMRWPMLAELRRHQVHMLTGVRYQRVDADGVWITMRENNAVTSRLIPARTVVIAAGQLPEDSLAPHLDRAGVYYRRVGGARSTESLDAVRAFAEGVEAARQLMARP